MVSIPMKIEQNVAKIEHQEGDYHIVLMVERRGAEKVSRKDVELVLTKVDPFLFTRRRGLGGSS